MQPILLAALLSVTIARVQTEVARVEQDVAAAELKRTQLERDLLTRRSAPRETLRRNQQDLRSAQDRVQAAERAVQRLEEH